MFNYFFINKKSKFDFKGLEIAEEAFVKHDDEN